MIDESTCGTGVFEMRPVVECADPGLGRTQGGVPISERYQGFQPSGVTSTSELSNT